MGEKDGWGLPPTSSPLYTQRDDNWRHFDNSVNAVSFGFVATAILISMFLVMAIFERFLRPSSSVSTPSRDRYHGDIESQMGFNGKLGHPSPRVSANAREVSVLMPGEDIPTFIAHPAPMPCPPEHILCPPHQHISLPAFTSNTNSHTNLSSSST
ncbi:uncharacterized protein LOC132266304 [Cornus florida]|uniref:uncharacterized protein LOC132266304 n=1 Tax=Cornus florida TaxID=4283 RepID=UPI002896963D|nr:uncharacterized protein LOC132266304 [Cornus florida]